MSKVGILADDRLQQHHLRNALVQFGFNIALNTTPEQFDCTQDFSNIDVWVVDVKAEDEHSLNCLDVLLSGDTPVFFGIEKAPEKHSLYFAKWEKKLYRKLLSLEVSLPDLKANKQNTPATAKQPAAATNLPQEFKLQEFIGQKAQEVWVLGASLGGPAAIKQFFDALPYGLPVAFIYAQHIDPSFETTLGKTIGRHSQYLFKNFSEQSCINYGDVFIAPMQNEFYFNQQLQLQDKKTPWPGPYGPSINQVILNTYQAYGERSGYIIFSGMGDDGAEAIQQITSDNLPIWAQLPESCANSSMPESSINTGRINFIGTPEQIAAQLVNHLKQHWKQAL